MTVRNNSLVVQPLSQWVYYKSYDTEILILTYKWLLQAARASNILHFFVQSMNLFLSTTTLNVNVALQ